MSKLTDRRQTSGYQCGVEKGGIIYERGHGGYKPLGVRYVQGCIVQHREYSQYFIQTLSGN